MSEIVKLTAAQNDEHNKNAAFLSIAEQQFGENTLSASPAFSPKNII